jgi:hypothetical protein
MNNGGSETSLSKKYQQKHSAAEGDIIEIFME